MTEPAGGRVRTSTIVLCVAFVAVLALYLLVRPEPLPEPGSPTFPVATTLPSDTTTTVPVEDTTPTSTSPTTTPTSPTATSTPTSTVPPTTTDTTPPPGPAGSGTG